MALVVFLRGVNVGGHRTFRPSILTKKLKAFDVINIGAAGTFVVHKPGSLSRFRAALFKNLPFKTGVVICDGQDFLTLVEENPFPPQWSKIGFVRFVTFLEKTPKRTLESMAFPSEKEWYVRVVGARGPFVFGVYRRHMKTIRYLGEIDKYCGGLVTTRNWNTVIKIAEIIKRQ